MELIRLQQVAALSPVPPPVAAAPQDPALSLPASPEVEAWLAALETACVAHGAALQRVAVVRRPSNDRQLGRAEVSVRMQAPYLAVTAVLSQLSDSGAAQIWRRIVMRRIPGGTDSLDVEWDVWLPSRPAQTAR